MPLTIVIIGATGDLTARKLVPALFALFGKGRLADEVRIVGVARTTMADEDFHSRMADAVREHAATEWNPARWENFARRLCYVSADASRADGLQNLQDWL